MRIIGRKSEINELERLAHSGAPEFVAVYGRRRVGKTFLVKEFFGNNFVFYATGVSRGTKAEQLQNFQDSLLEYGYKGETTAPKDWTEAFKRLRELVEKSRQKRKVIFLDELPWMDTQKSRFVQAIDLFWNKWCSTQEAVMLVVCGSAASWMVKNIINNRGGLHNRITSKIHLMPFTLGETREYLQSRGVRWSEQTLAECYMVMGGIPYYLQQIDRSMSLAQNVDRMFFKENALLGDEFENLYSSLFTHSSDHVEIVRALSRKRQGLTRDEIVTETSLSDGGGLTRRLTELEQCGFIRQYTMFSNARQLYQLTDFYTQFYFQFLAKEKSYDDEQWLHLQGMPRHNNWLGLSFERLCFAHIPQIRKSLGIAGVATKTFAYQTEGVQVDMVIERADKTVCVCEIKWSSLPYSISKAEDAKMRNRMVAVRERYPRWALMMVMVTAGGLVHNEYVIRDVQREVVLEDLFG
jgi:Predicted ATPase (AAA+ superfamily)